MRNQEIKYLKITDLKLWSENPRDPLQNEISDFEIIQNAILHKESKWQLNKLMKQIGDFYDYSELPIVVKIDSQYIVYDGNRRISLIKYLQSEAKYNKIGAKLTHKNKHEFLELKKIPCNVCTINIALDNIERKHIDNGTWNELERDYFKHIHRFEEKSIFIKIDEASKIVSNNSKLNKGYVKNEILTKSNLESIGIGLDVNNEISTIYDVQFTKELINHIVEIIVSKEITTRKNRGKLKEVLESKNLKDSLVKYEESLKKYTLEDVYKITFDNSTSPEDASSEPTFNGSLTGTFAFNDSSSGGSSSGGSSSGGSSSGGSSSGGSSSGGSSSGGSSSGGSSSGGSSYDPYRQTRSTTKKKPDYKRKQIDQGIKKRIDEFFSLDPYASPNAKIAMSRVLFECILKYVIENTEYNGHTMMSKSGYFQPAYKDSKYTNFRKLRHQFIELIKNPGDRNAMNSFDLDNLHQIVHNYKVNGVPIDAINITANLIPLIEFLLQEKSDLLDSLDVSLIK